MGNPFLKLGFAPYKLAPSARVWFYESFDMSKKHEIRIDRRKSQSEEPGTGHNRWHPDIPPILRVDPGDTVVMETRNCLDCAITRKTTADDLTRLELGKVHPLTGPVYVKGAEPGDLLEVKILKVEPQSLGFTCLIPGFGILRDYFPKPFLVKWDIDDRFATSRDLPGVRISDGSFMGIMGVAPSGALVKRATARESELLARGGAVFPPSPQAAVPSSGPAARDGLRTIPPRENGGNTDVKQMTAGTTVYYPVLTPGALFSAGDAHFAQGDGESCGTAVEMGATLTVRLDLGKGKATELHERAVHFERKGHRPSTHGSQDFYAVTGIPIRDNGTNESEDVTLAAKNALLSMIDHLVAEYGYSREQAYALTSVAVNLHISELVDVPNVLVSAFLPLHIFVKRGR
jgi:formamidase